MVYRSIQYLLALLAILCVHAHSIAMERSVSVEDFGAKPNDNIDDSKALANAAAYCRENPNTVLVFSPGNYILKNELGIKTEKAAMRGDLGQNPESIIFKPNYPYGKGMDFSGSKSVSIEGNGAVIQCYGWFEPISIMNCENFSLKNITIDYPHKPFSWGKVIEVTDSYFEVKFSNDRVIDNQMVLGRMTFWDLQEDLLTRDVIYFPNREILGNNRVRFHHKIRKENLGQVANVLHCFHFRPAILISGSKQTSIQDVTIHAQPGMGIVGFDSHDILINRLNVRPAPGYYQSTNTDATHFACCSGLLRFDGCYFEAQGDDATNVHGYYHTVIALDETTFVTKLEAPTFTHSQEIDLPRVGDKLELVHRETLQVIDTLIVEEAISDKATLQNKIRVHKKLNIEPQNYYVMNVSKLPQLEFVNSTINSHLARAILVKTRDVLIENNRINGSSNTAIHIGAEAWWSEGTHSQNVTVRNNIITNCGFQSTQGGASGIAVIIDAKNTSNTYLHKNIKIENNTIVGSNNICGIFIGNTIGVQLINNIIQKCKQDILIKSSSEVKILSK